jgi:hypothetical protein
MSRSASDAISYGALGQSLCPALMLVLELLTLLPKAISIYLEKYIS